MRKPNFKLPSLKLYNFPPDNLTNFITCHLINFLLLTLSVFLFACEESVTPVDPSKPRAILNSNQEIPLGSYFILDGSKSEKGYGDTLMYHWGQSPENPSPMHLFNNGIVYRAPAVQGNYKFTLVVFNGSDTSNTAEINIKVTDRIESEIKDPMLECCIRYQLQKQYGGLSNSDFLNVEYLNLAGIIKSEEVKDLSGIENCVNLNFLNATGESISDVTPLTPLTKLFYLDVDQNHKIYDISPLAGLTNLTHLNIFANLINDISSLKNLTKLEYLDICNNPVNDISVVSNFQYLKEFFASFNEVTNLSSFKNLVNLEKLYFVYSKLNDISGLANCVKIKQMVLAANEITDISALKNMKDLQLLWMDQNKIKDLSPLGDLPKLIDLVLWGNKIEDIKPLADNSGIGQGAMILIQDNPLNEKSISEYIPALIARGGTGLLAVNTLQLNNKEILRGK